MGLPVNDLVQRIRYELEDHPFEDKITLSTTAIASTITVPDGTKWAKGVRLEWDDLSGEIDSVFGVAGNVLTLRRPPDAVAHAANSYVLRAPRFEYKQIVEAMNRVLHAEMWPYVWAVKTTRVTPVSGTNLYSVPSDLIDLISVTQATNDTNQYSVYGGTGSGLPVSVLHGLTETTFGSGQALYLPSVASTSEEIFVIYRAIPSLSDIEDGMMADTLVYGACSRLVGSKATKRIVGDATMGEQTTQSPDTLQVALWYEDQFRRARNGLNAYLMKTAPPMRTWG